MRQTIKSSIALLASVAFITACASHPDKIAAAYISPMQYEGYSCKQIAREMRTVSGRVSEIGGQQEKVASNDDVAMGVGLVLFWPALFFLDSNSAQAAEYARLKGEFNALEEEGNTKNCGLHIEQPKITTPAPTKTNNSEYPTPGGIRH